MVVDQLASGSWVFLFIWLVVVAYLVPTVTPCRHGGAAGCCAGSPESSRSSSGPRAT